MPRTCPPYVNDDGKYDVVKGIPAGDLELYCRKKRIDRANYEGGWAVGRTSFYKIKKAIERYKSEQR